MKITQEEPVSFCSILAFDCKHVDMYCLANKLTGDSHLSEVNISVLTSLKLLKSNVQYCHLTLIQGQGITSAYSWT